MFVKYRTKHSAGPGPWDVTEINEDYIGPDSNIGEYLDGELNTGSEHWRGVEWKKLDVPPKDYLLKKITSLKKDIEYSKSELERYKFLYDKHYILGLK